MDIDTILEKWELAKQKKANTEKECEKYKGAVERYMNKKGTDSVSSKYYTVTRRSNTRQQLSKQRVPPDIWERYANRITYTSYHIKKK